ncbi:MAG: alginate export family protein [Holophaga sp.]|nr:alginate export family protein [Holophaga sp.]
MKTYFTPSRLAMALAVSSSLMAQAPAPRGIFEVGFEERVRLEDHDNIIDHNDAKVDFSTYYRFRSRAWLTANPTSDLEFSVGICNENRKITRPDKAYNGREVFFDTFYVDYKFSKAWSVRVGRQNLMRGEGFVLFDGGALDGSRAAYFNALDLTYSWSRSKLEFLAISNPLKDQYLPRLNEANGPGETPQRLNERDEQALGLYYTAKEWTGTTLEAYYFLKTEKNDYRPIANAQFQADRRISTLGSRAVREFQDGWSVNGEFAYQWGTQDGRPGTAETHRDIGSWGGYGRVKKVVAAPWKPTFSAAYIAMSGQDPNSTASSKITAWDPIFSRWPRWSELYIYSQVPEKGVAYSTNTVMWEEEVRLSPLASLDLRATYYKMAALQAPSILPGTTFGTGKTRGDILQFRADYKFSPEFKGYILYEHLTPGDFYVGKDGGHFLRVELSYLFKTRF